MTSDHEVEADPVLPWGKQGDSQLTNVFQDLGLIFGASRIQVQWRIGPDDDDGTGPSHLVVCFKIHSLFG